MALARKLAERPVGYSQVGVVLAMVVAFGALCASAGYSLAMPARPFWVTKDTGLGAVPRALSGVLALPAGWMIFALLVPAAVHGAKVGRSMFTDPAAGRRDKVFGGALIVACLLGGIGCAVLLAKLL